MHFLGWGGGPISCTLSLVKLWEFLEIKSSKVYILFMTKKNFIFRGSSINIIIETSCSSMARIGIVLDIASIVQFEGWIKHLY